VASCSEKEQREGGGGRAPLSERERVPVMEMAELSKESSRLSPMTTDAGRERDALAIVRRGSKRGRKKAVSRHRGSNTHEGE